jgi:hypothetical protein
VIIFAYRIVKCLLVKTFRTILRIFYQYRPRFHTETRRAKNSDPYLFPSRGRKSLVLGNRQEGAPELGKWEEGSRGGGRKKLTAESGGNHGHLQLLNNCCHCRDNMSCGSPERHSSESNLDIEISLSLI